MTEAEEMTTSSGNDGDNTINLISTRNSTIILDFSFRNLGTMTGIYYGVTHRGRHTAERPPVIEHHWLFVMMLLEEWKWGGLLH